MSCKIPVDTIDHLDTPNTSYNSTTRGLLRRTFDQKKPNIFARISRTVQSRRLRLSKVYMALIVIFLLLFYFLYPNGAPPDRFNDDYVESSFTNSKFKYESVMGQDESINDLRSITKNQAEPANRLVQPITGMSHLPVTKALHKSHMKNFTYTLSATDFSKMKDINIMQVRVREAAKHSWDSYCKYAWGFDMLKPRSKTPDHWFNLGLTIVDSADTLIMMGMTQDMNIAINWLENELNFNSDNVNSNCFEMTIRILAGLLSAYHLTGREKLRQQAIDFGDILLNCYDSRSRIIPYSDIDLNTRRAHPPQWNPHSSLSEVASLQLEFRYLTQITGNPKYEETTFLTSEHIHNLTSTRRHKLLPMYINPNNGELEDSVITLGARTDSYYEYLLKQYLQTGIKWLEDDYLDSIDEVRDKLIKHTDGPENYTYVAEMQIYPGSNESEEYRYYHKMDHLICFLPGTLALGYYHFSPQAGEYRLKYNLEVPPSKLNSRYDFHLELSKALGRTCYHMYKNMGTGLSPEIASFVHSSTDDPTYQNQPELQVQSNSAHNILRPEFVESLFYLYHITGLPMYRNQATQIFEAFQKYSRIPSGFSAVSDVRQKPDSSLDIDEMLHKNAPDRMESFWLSETLKYLYLIFCDDKHIVGTILNNYVFNTEAHMFPII